MRGGSGRFKASEGGDLTHLTILSCPDAERDLRDGGRWRRRVKDAQRTLNPSDAPSRHARCNRAAPRQAFVVARSAFSGIFREFRVFRGFSSIAVYARKVSLPRFGDLFLSALSATLREINLLAFPFPNGIRATGAWREIRNVIALVACRTSPFHFLTRKRRERIGSPLY